MTTPRARRRTRPGFTFLAVQCAALAVGSLLIGWGLLGFLPAVTSGTPAMQLFAYRPGVALFGIFAVSLLHNLFYIGLGLCGLLMARSYGRSRAYLLAAGALLLGLWLHAVLTGPPVPGASADGWLHFGTGITMVILALTLAGSRVPTGARGEELPTAPDQHQSRFTL